MNEIAAGIAETLTRTVRECAAAGLCPATGGNFSARIALDRFWITASGVDKAGLNAADLLQMDLEGSVLTEGRPSAEAELHRALYVLDDAIGAVLHGHSVANTTLSRVAGNELVFEGYEMAKAIRGVHSHGARLALPVVDNSQDMTQLARMVEARHRAQPLPFAFLVRGHGIYAWGADLAEARRHLDGWEFLLACELTRRQIKESP